jgi:hypothetical protein
MALRSLARMADRRALTARVERVKQAEQLAASLCGEARRLGKAAHGRQGVPAAPGKALERLRSAQGARAKREAVQDASSVLIGRGKEDSNEN